MLKHMLEKLRNDNVSGSAELLKFAADILVKFPEKKTINAIRSAQPDMAPLYNLCELVKKSKNPTKDIADYLDSLAHAPQRIAAKLYPKLPEKITIITYSRSSTVKESILELHLLGKDINVITPESRPCFEGRSLGEELGEKGIQTTLMTDVAALSKLDSADCLMIGADRITPTLFVNKIGSYSFVLMARHVQVPSFLLTDSSKFVQQWPFSTDQNTHTDKEIYDQKK